MKEVTKKNIFVSPHDHLDVAIAMMNQYKVSGLAVVDQTGLLVGVLSAKDFLSLLVSSKYLNGPLGFVRDYMIDSPVSIKDGSSTQQMVDLFIKNSFHYYPVVDDKDMYKGTVYRTDLLETLSETPQTTW